MPVVALALVVAAAAIHATWNALTKRALDPFAFLWTAMGTSGLALLPIAVAIVAHEGVPRDAWLPMLGSGVVHALYFVTLSSAYRHGDLSVVYPIARGLGVALVPLLAAATLAETPSPLGALGIAVVVLGIGVTGAGSRRADRTIPVAALARAAATGVLIATYSVLDRTGARAMHPLPFVVGTNLIAVTLTAPLARRAAVLAEWRAHPRHVALAAAGSLGGYLLVLFAFRLAPTAYVAASREIAIAFAAAAGMTWLGEPRAPLRIAGAALVVAGVACVALAR